MRDEAHSAPNLHRAGSLFTNTTGLKARWNLLCVISSGLKAGLRPLMVLSDLGEFTQQHSGLTAKIFHVWLFTVFFTLITHPCWRELKEVKEAVEYWRKCINLYANKGF